MNEVAVFPEEINQLMGFDSLFTMDKMIYPTLASFVHLRQGLDRFIGMAKQLKDIQTKFGD